MMNQLVSARRRNELELHLMAFLADVTSDVRVHVEGGSSRMTMEFPRPRSITRNRPMRRDNNTRNSSGINPAQTSTRDSQTVNGRIDISRPGRITTRYDRRLCEHQLKAKKGEKIFCKKCHVRSRHTSRWYWPQLRKQER